ncbi:ABC transporter ATP-binding protein [Dactylosporangium sp. NPDC051485]|uniref:ABC transporter ATP-binding protein n=1 Tax=Dactylosporangium sp. NPDC051485 TaxID=3154846 RepID=UPI003445E3AC
MDFDGRRPVRTTLRLLAPGKARLALATLAFAVKDSPIWLLPLLTANIIDVVVQHRPVAQLWLNAGVLAVILLQNIPMHMLWVRQMSLIVRHLGTDLRSDLAGRLQQLSIGFHTKAGASLLQTKLVRDVENVEMMLQQVAASGTSAILTLLGALTLTAVRVPQFVPLFLLVVPCTAGLVAMVRRRSGARNEEFRRRVEELSARVDEMAHLMPITRAHALEQEAVHRMRGTVEEVRAAGLRLDMVNGRFGAMSWVTYQLLGAACLVAAGWAAWSGFAPVSAGDVVLLSTYFAVLTSSVIGLFGLAPIITKGLESIRSIGEVLSAPDLELNEGKQRVATVRGAIALEGVGYRYPDSPAPALAGIDLTVAEGETIAFVGPSGSGKSTMLNLLIGFIRPSEGRVLLDGEDMERIDLRSYRKFVSVVPQEPVLFDGTIWDNVTYGLAGQTEETVTRALRDANALEFVEDLPHGWDTVVGERGALLSGGQRQRLAIARALVRDPRVLLLDEATSALDSESEALVQEALTRLMRGRTTFVVAHRLATIRGADRIAVLAGGRLAELGTHEQLLAAGGLFARLHGLQSV